MIFNYSYNLYHLHILFGSSSKSNIPRSKMHIVDEVQVGDASNEEAPIYGDVLETILSHVPLINLVPASCVSKSWSRAVISSLNNFNKPKPWLILHTQSTRDPYSTSTHAYDPRSHVWIEISQPSIQSTSALRSSCSNFIYMLSPSKFSFSQNPLRLTWHHVDAPRVWHVDPIVALLKDIIIIAGGTCEYEDDPLAVEMYDIKTQRWRTCEPMPPFLKNSAASMWLSATVANNKLFLMEKSSGVTHWFDPKTQNCIVFFPFSCCVVCVKKSMDISSKRRHIAILSIPGMGHLIPTMVLANRLATNHNVKVTILVITTSTSPSGSQVVNFPGGEKLVDIVEMPPVDISHLINASTKVVTQLFMIAREALPGIKSTIAAMKHRPDALIVDLFGTEAFPIAEEFNMPKYVYVPTTAWFTALTLYCPVLDKEIEGQYVDQAEPFRIPGCKPVRPEDVVQPMLDRNDQQYHEYVLRQGIGFGLSDGILMNTWEELDHKSVKALRENEALWSIVKVPVYTIGPLMRPAEPARSKSHVTEWLDMQPSESVMYISFGSGGALSAQQMTELAYGLELSQQRFVWVVRPPVDGDADESYLTVGKCGVDGTPEYYLPEGFLARTHNKVGLVVSMWAQQVEILNHPSVGGFLSHCGWNSTLESIAGGVPMIAWPLYAEQSLNATLLTEELCVAVRPKVLPSTKVVNREEIEKLVRRVMQEKEGKAMRDKIVKLKASAENALSKGGSSYNSMCEFLNDVEMRLQS